MGLKIENFTDNSISVQTLVELVGLIRACISR